MYLTAIEITVINKSKSLAFVIITLFLWKSFILYVWLCLYSWMFFFLTLMFVLVRFVFISYVFLISILDPIFNLALSSMCVCVCVYVCVCEWVSVCFSFQSSVGVPSSFFRLSMRRWWCLSPPNVPINRTLLNHSFCFVFFVFPLYF